MQARKNLEFVRGTQDVDKEFDDLVEAADLAKQVKHPWRNMFSKKYFPQLILCGCSTLFQQWTGVSCLLAMHRNSELHTKNMPSAIESLPMLCKAHAYIIRGCLEQVHAHICKDMLACAVQLTKYHCVGNAVSCMSAQHCLVVSLTGCTCPVVLDLAFLPSAHL